MSVLVNLFDPDYTPQRTTLSGHTTSVIACLQVEDNYVITGGCDKMIRVYNLINKRFLLQLSGHDGEVWALKYAHGGILVSGSTDRTVRVWDIKKGCCTHVFKGHNSMVRCLDIVEYKNIKYIVTGSRDNTLHVWKLPKESSVPDHGEEHDYPLVFHTPEENPYFVGVLRGHTATVRTVSGHGNIVISGSYDNTLIVWDVAQMKCLYILSGHTDPSPCAKILGAMYTLRGHRALVGLLGLSDKFLVSASADGSIRCWDANTYFLKHFFDHTQLNTITALHVSDEVLVSGSEGLLNIYDLNSGLLVRSDTLSGADNVWNVSFKDNTLVAAVERDKRNLLEILDFS
ncbi:BAD_collapsed_G0015420.mRNA.1.CDS.1 [Saccharomyces cerevisiae]|nr:BAD_HP_G0015600.mRNA.1.CDS.1 [Saccharomyces cerevisiae]CAI4989392.1 BAD_HP_G0057810.mRNA.1.CDS.1 [Saccharomyces cerevisiae]CAI6478093.1 BAD_HP_G0015600.mRNA.1.CDS.1 [Saccharomyces cerevisiae]CAI6858481.1 BAD_HP_G0057810.mRNA.1.CDS.1 [Saccharomyces cerevisiae]CAI7263473.1 BAD_collapsed_G0015420.mRNA.1.CDS.1 [Saccharomyces cerevisiae]